MTWEVKNGSSLSMREESECPGSVETPVVIIRNYRNLQGDKWWKLKISQKLLCQLA